MNFIYSFDEIAFNRKLKDPGINRGISITLRFFAKRRSIGLKEKNISK